MTIFGIFNARYFVPANNPHGHYAWYAGRKERDAALKELEAQAKAHGLSDPQFPAVTRRIRTEQQRAWLLKLEARGLLLANGIDGPDRAPSHSWAE